MSSSDTTSITYAPKTCGCPATKQQKLVWRLEKDKGKYSSLLHPDRNELMKSPANISQHIMLHSNSFYHHSGICYVFSAVQHDCSPAPVNQKEGMSSYLPSSEEPRAPAGYLKQFLSGSVQKRGELACQEWMTKGRLLRHLHL
ncbi:hypothetical protein OJAV_G00105530 [Oryzias javanicus]|uniref:Uncharacterized protein n=1 Tax=Oryzias javanicus TaxID=123683 RepID=A0A437CYA2_ORYJA|nr:hypothetical protein OJAV_G00105530 [Oryzias javanicus]